MRLCTSLVVTFCSLLSLTEALHIRERRQAPKALAFPIQRQAISDPAQIHRIRGRDPQTVGLDNMEYFYFINASLGTPEQQVRLLLDTGSSDLWVNNAKSHLCEQNQTDCSLSGVYNANSSSTYKYLNNDFNDTYVDGSGASGEYATDRLVLGSIELQDVQFGIAYVSSSYEGILGIGYAANEGQVSLGQKPYHNVPELIKKNGYISTNSYSLWIDDLQAATGYIIFGGVDTEKYTGSLSTLPIQTVSGNYTDFLITLTELKLGKTKIGSEMAVAVLLDSGTSLTYLPDHLVQKIYAQVGASYDHNTTDAYVPCSLRSSDLKLTFTFSGPSITVPMEELVLDSDQTDEKTCKFGILSTNDGNYLFGDTFLRSAYVVYNLDENTISLAQTRPNATSSNLLEIKPGKNGVPDAVYVAHPVKATEGFGL